MTHTRVHVTVTLANPYLRCHTCLQWLTGRHDRTKCGCTADNWNTPCGCRAGASSVCPSWSPADGCCCQVTRGCVDHDKPPARATTEEHV